MKARHEKAVVRKRGPEKTKLREKALREAFGYTEKSEHGILLFPETADIPITSPPSHFRWLKKNSSEWRTIEKGRNLKRPGSRALALSRLSQLKKALPK